MAGVNPAVVPRETALDHVATRQTATLQTSDTYHTPKCLRGGLGEQEQGSAHAGQAQVTHRLACGAERVGGRMAAHVMGGYVGGRMAAHALNAGGRV